MDTNQKGDLAEAKVLAKLIEHYTVSIPFGDQRYDIVIETERHFSTVQVKNGRLRNGSIIFNSVSYGPRTNVENYLDIDYFGVYCPELDEVFLVPTQEVSVGRGVLRVDPVKQNESRVRWAADYRLGS